MSTTNFKSGRTSNASSETNVFSNHGILSSSPSSGLAPSTLISADRTSGVRLKPHFDATGVKPVTTAKQKSGFLSIDDIRETNDALDVIFEVFRVEVYDGD
ncbi:unnamed protein product [Microthlaspi erraticum]|uniref:Uncharacterized protein n=1 Tax=Microthlaspi erraticum TaxID=1685480 RepID=A0A6D2I7Y4_9BRAS|nr:unnamed protein product [Microthlaspi erraticum]